MRVSRRAFVRRSTGLAALLCGEAMLAGPSRARAIEPLPEPGPPRARTHVATRTLTLGRSVSRQPIEATGLGSGPVAVAFIGNIHGGWEPMARVVVDLGLDYFLEHPSEVPPQTTLYFVPTMNPDGYEAGRPLWEDADGTGGSGDTALAWTALNGHAIDLNRNFPTNWSRDACGGERARLIGGGPCLAGLGGPRPFSEPETRAYRDFILRRNVRWALTYHEDQIPAVLGREGGGGPSEPFALELAELAGYPYVPSTIAYPVTGHAWDWLDAIGVQGAEIELEYRALDWAFNLSAMRLLIEHALA